MPHNSVINDSKVLDAHTIDGFSPQFSEVPSGDQNSRYDVVSIQNLSNMEYIFDRDMQWIFHENITDVGKVAELKNIKIKPRIRQKQLCKKIHEKNYLVLKNHEFKQIRLTAKWDGVVVWPSLFFNFSDRNEEDNFYEILETYLLEIHNLNYTTVKAMIQRRDFSSIKNYLQPTKKMWFTEWYNSLESPIVFEMYKDIV